MSSQATTILRTPYSRTNPSPRYRELLAMYSQMHHQGGAQSNEEIVFPGVNLAPQAERICALIKRTKATSLLDYGCGKGILYRGGGISVASRSYPSVQNFWGIDNITLYDPAYPPFIALPQGTFDGVISTDVLEHCPQDDMEWILAELFGYANHFVFANIASYPAKRIMPNGENAHCTVQPAAWWKPLIEHVASFFPQIQYQFVVTEIAWVNGNLVSKDLGEEKVKVNVERNIERIFRR